MVRGSILAFDRLSLQRTPPRPLTFSEADTFILDSAALEFIKHKLVERCVFTGGQGFFSKNFPVVKSDGTVRVILNLKHLNEHITHVHFKMESFKDVVHLIQPNCFFITIDLKDAYFSVYVKPDDRKWLRFMWKDQPFQFTGLHQGLTSAPHIFTKLLKPALSHLRKLGIVVSCYIDDCIFITPSADQLRGNVSYAMQLFDSLGLTINVKKSVLEPTTTVEFLGVLLNSSNMTATLPFCRRERIKQQDKLLLRRKVTLQELASFIGLAVASVPAVQLASLRYKYLEIIRNRELARSHGNYDVSLILDWWIHNIDSQFNSLRSSSPQFELHIDVSLPVWGPTVGGSRTGGHWAQAELDHIFFLELKAILMGLQSLCSDCRHTHIRLRSENTTAVACIDRCGSTKLNLHVLTERIFDWAQSRGIVLSAEHVRSIYNVGADKESRWKNLDAEWMLTPHVFRMLCHKFYTPDVDLFASRINAQVATYASWKPNPSTTYINAFTIDWGNRNLYAFPPFCVIGRVLKKLQADRATLLAILPLWPTQVWFPHALQLLANTPLILPQHSLILPQDPGRTHPRAPKLVLTAMLLSGNSLKTRAFHQRLPSFYLTHGEEVRNYNMGFASKDGCQFVSRGKLIRFNHLSISF